jgi:hypothetical protein
MRRRGESGQYREAANKGRTHDKVAFPDPAAAPVHADAEASGYPTSRPAFVAATRDQAGMTRSDADTDTGHRQGGTSSQVMAWLMGAAFAALALLGLTVAIVTLP